ncbi:MAG: alpha/beta hydrolase [Gemmatimonadales bacterium]|nr:MAG: alpha/beta hydrolase [Gemmatimonadales bacterium]
MTGGQSATKFRGVLILGLKIAAGLAVGYGVVAFLAWRFQEKLAFPGHKVRLIAPQSVGLEGGRIVTVTTSDGVLLKGWYLPPAGGGESGIKAPGLLWFYGNLESVSGLAPVVRELRLPEAALLILDYRGYGESGGRPTEEGLYRDAEAAWHFLAARPEVDSSRIAVYGRSLGSAMALYLAERKKVAAVVLDSPFTSARDMARVHYGFLPRSLVRLSLDNLNRAGKIEAPLLVFHGTEDRIAPPWMGEAVARAGRARELVWIEGAGHNDTYDLGFSAYRRKLHQFLRSVLETRARGQV